MNDHEKLEFCEEWYAVRIERLKDLAKKHDIWPEMACILANGTGDPYEPPTYAQQMNLLRYRAEKAEKKLELIAQEAGEWFPAWHGVCARAIFDIIEKDNT